ncbi:DUF3203 domain-containing protein [Pseudomonas gingeri NCPPB 3146 = LMG 5327]|uniref:DUF3203 family protein n=2 Tax=Pseudomonas gingeri TaxID=117681 RepID=A0A7Y7Y4L1_9PSED|nr:MULTISPECIES: DUF3203 family protein [Pseudomonas]NVZ27662.1 DUF3203 family protein [Pseudomonas gingeri]NVZ64116.1 DUF3203 family protein [Pseudomonas gingeri]NVZ76582.1 DUF3203 family protein [Pseudomonas gingeri]NWA05681.1 DUF3203 family protein [Pseudomonas gingeri]NWC17496.1 DUF3203 family protein [Pseudomonas gingeri]
MPVKIDPSSQTCTLEGDHEGNPIEVHGSARDVTITTDDALRMSRAELDGQSIVITEQEADALTVAGAFDGRHHVKTTSSDSVI